MTTESKLQLLTGAVYACIDAKDGYFYHFGTLCEKGARNLIGQNLRHGVDTDGHFWVIRYSLRYLFINKDLTALFGNLG